MTNHGDMDQFGDRLDCGAVRDRIPVRLLGLLTRVESDEMVAHLARCEACREEEEFVRRLQCAACEPPMHLAPRILAAARTRPVRRRRGWLLALPAAAAVVLALGIGVFWNGEASQEFWTLALEPEATMRWYGNDWVVADEPQFHALPDEILRQILVELGP